MTKFSVDSAANGSVIIKLFKNVQNLVELKEKLASGALKCCLVNPKYIVHPLQLIVAANKALVAKNRTTKSIYTEILFNLSISKNITNSLKQFGASEENTDLLAVVVSDDDTAIFDQIHGDEIELERLEELSDLQAVNKLYKISPEESQSCTVLDSIVSRIATKDFISH